MLQNEVWEKLFQREYGRYPAEHLIRFIARNYYRAERGSTKILEVGCGPGANIWYLSREGFDTYGIDGSPTAIASAKLLLSKDNLSANLTTGDIVRLPYTNAYFDAVIDNECIYSNNLSDSHMIMSEIQRVIKKDALFFSRAFSRDMYVGKDAVKINDYEYLEATDGPLAHTGRFRLIDENGIKELYGVHFDILSIDKMDYTRDNRSTTISEWIIVCRKT
ncbi:MAG: class I SAM-dependent methyltransferase [Syntrophorhabdaceae bacterium]